MSSSTASREPLALLAAGAVALVVSGIGPHQRGTWRSSTAERRGGGAGASQRQLPEALPQAMFQISTNELPGIELPWARSFLLI